ncbi:hypothetical protein [Methylobacterium iners]|nr:hypothetical protein [Methylobacterium iners]
MIFSARLKLILVMDGLAVLVRGRAEPVERSGLDPSSLQPTEYAMRVFQVRQTTTGIILWTDTGPDEAFVLEIMIHEAGYVDAAHLPQTIQIVG